MAQGRMGPMARSAGVVALVAAGWTAAAGCGGGQTRGNPLDSRWSDHDGSELSAFQRRWTMPRAPELPGVAVGVVNDQTLVGRALSSGAEPWRFEHILEGRPVIAGSVVVGMGGGELFALDAATGELHWTRKALGRLRGAGDDGETTILSIACLSEAHSIVLAVGRNGDVVRQLHEQAVIGAPAVFDAYAFLPWNGEEVVIFDLLEGTEAARVVASDPVSHTFLVGGELYFGETTAVRFDDQIVAARRGGGSLVALPDRRWPGDPKWRVPGATPLPTMAGRDDRIRLHARPRSPASGPRLDDLALRYERLVMGLRAPVGALHWVHINANTVIGGAAAEHSFALCDTSGDIQWLDATTGRLLHRVGLGERLVACQLQSERSPEQAPPPARTPGLAEQITKALQVRDVRLLPMQLALLEELAAIEGSLVSAQLIALASQGGVAPRLTQTGRPRVQEVIAVRARELLAARRSGPEAMVAALAAGQPSHELRGGHPPTDSPPLLHLLRRDLLAWPRRPEIPVGPLATALQGMDEGRAAPVLAPYLTLPSLPNGELAAVARALEQLATQQELPWLVEFFARHRCNRVDAQLTRAVEAVERSLVRLGRPDLIDKITTESCDRGVTRK